MSGLPPSPISSSPTPLSAGAPSQADNTASDANAVDKSHNFMVPPLAKLRTCPKRPSSIGDTLHHTPKRSEPLSARSKPRSAQTAAVHQTAAAAQTSLDESERADLTAWRPALATGHHRDRELPRPACARVQSDQPDAQRALGLAFPQAKRDLGKTPCLCKGLRPVRQRQKTTWALHGHKALSD